MKMNLLVLSLFSSAAFFALGAQAEFTNGQTADLVLGQPDFTSTGSGTTATTLSSNFGVAVSSTSSKIYVADQGNSRILRFPFPASNGAAAEGVLGKLDFTTNGGGTSQALMAAPTAISFDNAGNLWVADSLNHRVLLFRNADSLGNGAPADLVLGQPDFTTNSSGTSQTKMSYPSGLQIDPNGRLWVLDAQNNRVLWFDDAANLTNGAPASGVIGQTDFTSSSTGTTQGTLDGPVDIQYQDNHLWISDPGNARVLRFDNADSLENGSLASGVLGQTNFTNDSTGTSASKFIGNEHLAVDALGTLWVADYNNNRVLGFKNAAEKADGANADLVIGQANFTDSSCTPSSTATCGPSDVAIDLEGRLLVSEFDNHRITRFSHPAAQPDARVFRGVRTKGGGIVNSTGAGQQLKFNFPLNRKRARISFSVRNASTTNDADAYFLEHSSFDKNKFRVRYFPKYVEFNTEVRAGTSMIYNVAPGEERIIVARIRTNSKTSTFSKRITLTVSSALDENLVDVARCKVTR